MMPFQEISIDKKKIITIAGILFSFILYSHLHVSAESNTYYVSIDGNDEHAGTRENPWRSIQYGVTQLKPGETLFVRGGQYSEYVHITNSGSKEEGPITIQSYPGEKVVLDGQNLSLDDGDTFFYFENAHYIIVDGFEVRNLVTDNRDDYPAGFLVLDGSSHIIIRNNHIHHIENHSKKGNAHGILIYGNIATPIRNITIENNQIHHLILGNSEALTVSGNVDGFTISENRVHDNNNIGIDLAGFYKACKEENCLDQARNGVVSNNHVFNNSSGKNPAYGGTYAAGGIYADGATKIIIKENMISNNDFGIELASENYGKTTSYITVERNKIFNNNGAGLILGGSDRSNGGAYRNTISNNFFKKNDRMKQGYGEITIQENATQNELINNSFFTRFGHKFTQDVGRTGKKDLGVDFMTNSIGETFRLKDQVFLYRILFNQEKMDE